MKKGSLLLCSLLFVGCESFPKGYNRAEHVTPIPPGGGSIDEKGFYFDENGMWVMDNNNLITVKQLKDAGYSFVGGKWVN